MKNRSWLLALQTAILLLACGAVSSRGGELILGPGTPMRRYVTWRTPVVRDSDGKTAPVTRCGSWRSTEVHTAAPPQGWQQPDFDDRHWSPYRAASAPDAKDGERTMALLYGQTRSYRLAPATAVVLLRARFRVTAPSALELTLRYRGGAAVCVNGKEVSRRHLPAGELSAESLAEDYPPEAFETAPGKPIPFHNTSPRNFAKNLKLRVRELKATVDAGLLRPGINVLAVRIQRAPFRGTEIAKMRRGHIGFVWGQCGLVGLELRGGGALPNTSRPAGVQIGAVGTAESSTAGSIDPLEGERPLEIFGARNGTFTGRVSLSSPDVIPGVKASITDLKHPGGKGAIPASSVRILYAHGEALRPDAPAGIQPTADRRGGRRLDAEAEVWVKARVPERAAPGFYEGELTVSAGRSRTIPVRLTVADWKVPDPRDWETIQGFLQSVALKYGVPLWSDEHFKLMEESWRLMGEAGGKEIVLHLVGRSCLGNEHSAVRWIRDEQAPGGYRHDFSVLDRYLDVALRHVRPQVTVLYVWEKYMGGHGRFAYIDKGRAANTLPARVTQLDPKTGKLSLIDGPYMDGGKFDAAAARAFWKPVCDGVLARLRKRGIADTAVLGMVGDGRPSGEAVGVFRELLPGVTWSENGHVVRLGKDFSGVKIGYATGVYVSQPAPPAGNGARRYGWGRRLTLFPRYGQFFNTRLSEWSPPALHRAVTEMTLLTAMNGVGRFGVDFWEFRKDRDRKVRDSSTSISGRFPESNQAQLNIHHSMRYVLAPGPKGAVPTTRYENLREGVQEAQARVFIEKAIAGRKIGGKLAERAQAVLDERAHLLRAGMLTQDWEAVAPSLTSGMAARLYAVAAEVAGAAGR